MGREVAAARRGAGLSRAVKALVALLLCGALAALAAGGAEASEAARRGLALCARSVAPSLFPFFVICSLISELGYARVAGRLLTPIMRPLFSVGGSGAAALALGLVGGYPSGARTAALLYTRGELGRDEAERLLAFCNNCSPAFILGIAGGAMGGARYGWLLYAAHVISALLCGLALGAVFRLRRVASRRGTRDSERILRNYTAQLDSGEHVAASCGFAEAFTRSVASALGSTLAVCAFVVFFTVVVSLLRLPGVVSGLLEVTGGVCALGESSLPPKLRLAAAGGLLGFGGLSVHAQALSFILPAGLSPRRYLAGKALHGATAALVTLLLAGA